MNILRVLCNFIAPAKAVLAKQMLHLVVQFDLAYDHLKAHWKEMGGIPEQEALELMDNARQAVEAFSVFMDEFSERAGVHYRPPKHSRP